MVAYYHGGLAECLAHAVIKRETYGGHTAYNQIGKPVEQIVQEPVLPLPLAADEYNQYYRSADNDRYQQETKKGIISNVMTA